MPLFFPLLRRGYSRGFQNFKGRPIRWASGTALIEAEGQGAPPSGHRCLAIKHSNL